MTRIPSDPLRLRRVRELFDALVDLDPAARSVAIAAIAPEDRPLLPEVSDLLAREDAAAGLDLDAVHTQVSASLQQLWPEAVAAGSIVGAFEVEAEIGAGGMGRVFRARRRDPNLEQRVAIKVLRRDSLGAGAIARFLEERAMLARLTHPGICQFIDAGTLADGSPYFVMELLDRAEAILAFAEQRSLSISERVILFGKVLAAVQHAHQALVVHRDLKNSNVLVLPDGTPKLVDFGIAKTLADAAGTSRTATAERFLSLASAAPEQLTGAPVGVACDVYALGVLLYELLAGRAPFASQDGSIPELIDQIMHRAPPSLATAAAALDDAALARRHVSRRRLRQALGGDLGDIVSRCLRKEPGQRYPSVEALAADLERWRLGLPISLRGGDRGYRLRRFVARHRLASALVLALTVSWIAATWIVAAQNLRIRSERDQAQQALSWLRESFLAADPARMGGELVSASDLLRATLPQLQARQAEQPLVFADLGTTIAEIMLELGLPTDAERLLDQILAVDARQALPGPLIGRVRLLKARSLIAGNAIEAAERWLGPEPARDSELHVPWLLERGRLQVRANRPEAAIKPLTDAALARQGQGAEDALFATAQRARVDALLRLRRLDAADRALGELEKHQHSLPETHTQRMLTRMLRVVVLRRQGRHDDALVLAQRVQQGLESDFGADSPIAARGRVLIGNIELVRARPQAALDAYDRARATQRSRLGDGHPETLRTRLNRIEAMAALGSERSSLDAEFESLLADALAGNDGPGTFPAFVLRQWALSLRATGAPERAVALLRSERADRALVVANDTERTAHRKLLAELGAGPPANPL